ncbi:MAG TPA: hypothetical protein VEB20_22470 [Azospirillaceae bacterium]|nr:hypothetical protein [Azospirillaceae bacterium]
MERDARVGQGGRIGIPDLLEPVLNAGDGEDADLRDAVTLVAEAMGALGITVLRRDGTPVPGVTDARAVLHLLKLYRQCLSRDGRLEDAMALRDLARRVERLDLDRAP